MAEEKKVESVVFLNHTNNPYVIKCVDGVVRRIGIGESVEVTKERAISLRKVTGFVDASKYQRPSSEVESLKKEKAELAEKCEALAKENAGLKEDLAKAKKK